MTGAGFNISDSCLRQAALLSEWGKMGVTLVRVGSSFVSGEQWTAAADAEALRYAAAIWVAFFQVWVAFF